MAKSLRFIPVLLAILLFSDGRAQEKADTSEKRGTTSEEAGSTSEKKGLIEDNGNASSHCSNAVIMLHLGMANTYFLTARRFEKWPSKSVKFCPRNAQECVLPRPYFRDGRFYGLLAVKAFPSNSQIIFHQHFPHIYNPSDPYSEWAMPPRKN
jgi:hypothetical protein